MQRQKRASRNGGQSAGLREAAVPVPGRGGGWRNNVMAMDDNGNDSNVVKEWRWTGGRGR